MLGYVISKKENINVYNYEVKNLNVLCDTADNIFIVENDVILYKNDIVENACRYKHYDVLEWFVCSGYLTKYKNTRKKYRLLLFAFEYGYYEILQCIEHEKFCFDGDEKDCYPYDYELFEAAMARVYMKGDFRFIKWIKKNIKIKFKKLSYIDNYDAMNWYVDNLNFKMLLKNKQIYFIMFFTQLCRNKIKTKKYKIRNKYFKGYKKN